MNRVDEKIRNVFITLSCLGLSGYFIAYFTPSNGIRSRLTYDHFICSGILVVLTLFSIRGELKPIRWNRLVWGLFFSSGLGIILISFLHPIGSGYRAFALMMTVGFPCLYFVWNNRGDYDSLFKRLSAATSVVGILYYIYCFYLSDRGELKIVSGRVNGAFYDANMYSMLGMVMACTALYMLLVNRNNWLWMLLSAASLGTGISIVKLGASRLSILVVLGAMLAFTIYYIKIQPTFTWATKCWHKILRAELLIVSVIIFIFAGNLMLTINNARAIAAQQAADFVSEEAGAETGQPATETETPAEISVLDNNTVDVVDRFSTEGMDLDAYTAGRYHIWQGYAQFLNLLGNDFSKADWDELTRHKVRHAHNNFLEIAYRCGVPVACLHVFLELVAGIICLIWLFNPKYREAYYLFCIVFMICYTVQSLFDIATLPFERPAPFYFYMMMIPVFIFGTDAAAKTGNHG